ncbi:MAG TPA: MEDS domain-containing protein [Candidatus Rubrimentiphilum sp.]|nr:MEDS domain-containing protein [Candidatus Rubrimentiphilum sp.]
MQFCGADERFLVRNVGRFLFEGLEAGDSLAIVATQSRRDKFVDEIMRLGGDAGSASAEGRLRLLDRDRTLEQICVAGQPNRERFDEIIGGMLRKLPGERIRAYGEMVGKLWEEGRRAEAICLEDLWNDLQKTTPFTLFCSYSIDVFSDDFQLASVDPVLCAHTQLFPGGLDRALERAVNTAMDDVLGDRVHNLRSLIKANYRPSWGVVPRPESMILWLRNNLPDLADAIVDRAREHYDLLSREASWEPA